MSSYVNWYLRKGETNTYIYLNGYSRNHEIYKAFNDVVGGYSELAKEITIAQIQDMKNYIKDMQESYKAHLKRIDDLIDIALKADNSLEEKMVYINDLKGDDYYADVQDAIESCNYALFFFSFIEDLIINNGQRPTVFAGIEACNPSGEEEEYNLN